MILSSHVGINCFLIELRVKNEVLSANIFILMFDLVSMFYNIGHMTDNPYL